MAADSVGPLAIVQRLLRLWRLYATMDLLYLMRATKTAVPWYTSELLIGVAAITATFLLSERFDGLGEWTKPQVLFLLGYSLLVRGMTETFFSYNVAFISRRVGRGQLDHVLVQPQPLWMALITEGFSPFSGSGMLVPGIVLVVWASIALPV